MSGSPHPARCPRCGEANDCQVAQGRTHCWCFDVTVAAEQLDALPADARGVACVCRRCAMRPDRADELARREGALRWTRR